MSENFKTQPGPVAQNATPRPPAGNCNPGSLDQKIKMSKSVRSSVCFNKHEQACQQPCSSWPAQPCSSWPAQPCSSWLAQPCSSWLAQWCSSLSTGKGRDGSFNRNPGKAGQFSTWLCANTLSRFAGMIFCWLWLNCQVTRCRKCLRWEKAWIWE